MQDRIIFEKHLSSAQMLLYNAHCHYGTSIHTSVFNNELNKPAPGCFSSGVHPWNSDEAMDEKLLIKRLEHPRCVALGEIGLDRLKGPSLLVQEKCFEQQLRLNESFELPIIIHEVKTLDLIKSYQQQYPSFLFVLHGFHKIKQIEKLNSSFYFSVGAAVLKRPKLQENIDLIPMDRLLIETDDQKGHVLEDIYHKIAELKKIERLSLQAQVESNFTTVFKKCRIG